MFLECLSTPFFSSQRIKEKSFSIYRYVNKQLWLNDYLGGGFWKM